MTATTSRIYEKKFLAVWATPIPDRVKALFTEVFINVSELVKYVSKDITKTDIFHLVIPLNCLMDLLNDPIYKFPQVVHIDVIYDGIYDLKKIQRRFNFEPEKIKFHTINELLRQLEKVELDRTLVSSGPIDRSTIDAIISIIEDRVRAKQQATFNRLSSFLKQCASTSLHGLPAKNINDIAPYFICSSCKFIYLQLYLLECGHQQCKVCVNIRKSCAICFKAVLRDKVLLVRSSQMKMQNLSIHCSNCEWTGSLKDYQRHFKHDHYKLITGFIDNQEINENISSLNSDVSVMSLNGICIWEIPDINDMRNNSASDEQKSIYSSSFYSFSNGYRICLRLFLNGDAKAKGTHMSLFFVLMQGNYDDVLRWPFEFKITFTLLNHLSPNNNQSKFFWPDTKSIAFQCPISNMNIAYGFSKFFPLDLFEQNENHYVKDDRILIQVEIDVLAERPTLPLISGAGELVNEEELVDTTYDNLPRLLCTSDI
ncbi:unnamed protein product [Rotaria sordida]|uniref:MATH domain-containing protein n=1 Tax=Rotaria sordida TaxID=392033 RepID=A0A814WEH5_9BILA|nr:unnamed protein product [Rotaria sordida]CAF3808319.1 unnamed protein product [Rotaria sordida]